MGYEVVPTMSEEQAKWLQSKLENFELIYAGYHGSHIYGLSRPESDIDIKAVYLPNKKDLVLGYANKPHVLKNKELDIEVEIKSLSDFLRSCWSCDTNCIDLLHTPEEMVLLRTELWDSLQKHRSCLYAKNMKGMIGYIKTHAKKYTNKIDRFKEMSELYEHCSEFKDTDTIGYLVRCGITNFGWKFIKPVSIVGDGYHKYLDICGKKLIYTWSILELKDALKREMSRYGKRTAVGVDVGIDCKSLSHALRVLEELKEIISTKTLTFPIKNVEYIKAVKVGEVTNLTEVLDKIDTLYDECMVLLASSDLPDEVDISPMISEVVRYYFGEEDV